MTTHNTWLHSYTQYSPHNTQNEHFHKYYKETNSKINFEHLSDLYNRGVINDSITLIYRVWEPQKTRRLYYGKLIPIIYYKYINKTSPRKSTSERL